MRTLAHSPLAQGAKLGVVSKALAKGARDVVTSGVVYWGAAAEADLQVGGCNDGVHVWRWGLQVPGRKVQLSALGC